MTEIKSLDKLSAARFLGVSSRDLDRYVQSEALHPLFATKGGEARFTEWELRSLKRRLDAGRTPDAEPAVRHEFSEQIWSLLCCPHCHAHLSPTQEGVRCAGCATDFGYSRTGALDLRPKRSERRSTEFEILPPEDSSQAIRQLIECSNAPREKAGGSDVWGEKELKQWYATYWPRRAPGPNAVALELGCGDILKRAEIETLGFEYLGVDYESTHAHMFADVHSLPFSDNSFSFITALSVLEHVQFPNVAMREIYRVLQPGGTFIGTVSFLEPFHMNSFCHLTHLGVANTLRHAGFENISVAPSAESWSGLIAQTDMILFPNMAKWLARMCVLPVGMLHRLWWRLLRLFRSHPWYGEMNRARSTTGAFNYYCTKL